METIQHSDALLVFRRRVLSVAAGALAVGVLLLAIVVPLTVPATSWRDTVVLVAAAAVHLAAATTVGRRWEPGGAACAAYLVVILLLVGVGVGIAVSPGSDAFWFLLISLGLSALTMEAWAHVGLVIIGIAVYITASALGPGLTLTWVAPRSVAAVLFATILFALARRLEAALVEVEMARHDVQSKFSELELVNERLAVLDAAKDEFVSTVAHELRTPLTSVIGMSSTLGKRWDQLEDDERRSMVDVVLRNARGIEGIVASLLDLARIERGGFVPKSDRLDLAELLGDAARRLEPVLREHDLALDLAEPAVVASDRALLERVIDNLLVNAARHTAAGTSIVVRTSTTNGRVRVEVADHGPGIPEDELARLSERFYRAGGDVSAPGEGAGLGLSLVADVLAALGSTLEVASVPGQGSTFAFHLPAAILTS